VTRQPTRRRTAVTAVSRAAIACPLGECRVLVAPATGWPLGVDARFVEQDTWLVLGASDRLDAVPQPGAGQADAMQVQQPAAPGRLHSMGGRPETIWAVVYDVDSDPTTRPAWVRAAWQALGDRVRRRGYSAIAAPLFGAAHSRLGMDELVGALREAWDDAPPPGLKRFWLLVPPRMSATSVARRLAA